MTKTDQINIIAKENPELSNREIAKMVGCSRRLVRGVRGAQPKDGSKIPKILIFDIETSPMEVFVWGLYKQRIPIDNIIKDWSILSWSAKWFMDSNIMSARVRGKEAIDRKDTSIIAELWDLFDEADILIGHNAQRFDVRKTNLRFALNGLWPPRPYKVIDTMKQSMKVFNSASYKLDYLNKIFGNGAKLDAPYKLWVDAVNGSDKALRQMEIYNRGDVVITEELYLSLRPWIKGHPNLGLYMDTEDIVCTNCGSLDLEINGHYFTPAGKYEAFRCMACGAIGRSRIADLTKEQRASLLLSIAV